LIEQSETVQEARERLMRQVPKRVERAASQAHAARCIDELPDHYEAVVGDRGIRLSRGQRQRIFLARELFKTPIC
jgi:ABC-type multidrug transport system fused ATPase/permease subunit